MVVAGVFTGKEVERGGATVVEARELGGLEKLPSARFRTSRSLLPVSALELPWSGSKPLRPKSGKVALGTNGNLESTA